MAHLRVDDLLQQSIGHFKDIPKPWDIDFSRAENIRAEFQIALFVNECLDFLLVFDETKLVDVIGESA